MKLVSALFSLSLLLSVSAVFAVDYATEVHPILKNHCGKCHMSGESKGGIALDQNKIANEIGDGSIVPGNVKKSDLHWTMTLSPDDDLAMPPKGRRVPQAEIDLIAKWIEEGAKIESTGGGGGEMSGGDAMGGDSMGGDSMGGGMAAAPAAATAKPYKGTFKNNSGKQVPATLVRVDGDRAILVLPDGKEYRYPIGMFHPDSKKIVEQWQAGSL